MVKPERELVLRLESTFGKFELVVLAFGFALDVEHSNCQVAVKPLRSQLSLAAGIQ